MKLSEYIISPDVRDELISLAKNQSDALWRIARLCLEVFQGFKVKQEEGDPKLQDIADYRVFVSLSRYVPRSPDRLKALADCAENYTPERVGFITDLYGEWDFGYYERTWKYSEIEQEAIFEFLYAVTRGQFVPKIAPRRLGVGEFISSYEFHVRHLQVAPPDCPENFPVGSASVFAWGLPFRAVYDAFNMLRKSLGRYGDNARARDIIARTEELERELGELIKEIEVDSRAGVRVE